ncbi:DUF3800 domain-containing protein [Pseudomonas baetica]|uniref:DUF3800 domain-containing protein n=1 Tax=Pseudomonas baetica TaxID=674054 RepID=UPI003B8A5A6D
MQFSLFESQSESRAIVEAAVLLYPAVQKFKFNHMGHDLIGLHELEIRKEKGAFSSLFTSRAHKQAFPDELTGIIEASNFVLISCVIDKALLREKQASADNPYHLALGFCLETLHEFLQEKHQQKALTHVIFERRGKREDNELELEFRRVCGGANRLGIRLPFDIVFATKQVNSTGLQLADLVARSIFEGRSGKSRVRCAQAQVLLQRWAAEQRWRRFRELGVEGFPSPRKRKAPVISPRH